MSTLTLYYELCTIIRDALFTNSSVSILPETLKNFVDKNLNCFKTMSKEFDEHKDKIEQYIHGLINDKIKEISMNADFNSFKGSSDILFDLVKLLEEYYINVKSDKDNIPKNETYFVLDVPIKFIALIFAQDYDNSANMLEFIKTYMNVKQIANADQIKECKEKIDKANINIKHLDSLLVQNEEKMTASLARFLEETRTIRKKTSKRFEDQINESQKKMHETNISILGIFSAIVLTFNASISFFAAILESLSTASTYKFILIILIIGFITTNIMFGLYTFISLIYKRSNTKKNLKNNTNKMYSKEKTKESNNVDQDKTSTSITIVKAPVKQAFLRDTWKFILPMLIANLAFLVSFIVLYATWDNGVIEDRNFEVSSSISSKMSSLQEASKETLALESETDKITENNSMDTTTEQSN